MTDETRTRFLASIAKQISASRVAEVHLFSAIRQGGIESGVAVIAVERDIPSLDVNGGDAPAASIAEADIVESLEAVAVSDQLADESAFVGDDLPADGDAERAAPRVVSPARYTIYTAHYRLTLKGPDRGKWEVHVTDEGDAPLLTVEAVIRGVQRRSGDAEEIARFNGDEFRALLPVPQGA